MNYELVKNRGELEKFIEFLPDCLENEQYYIALFARKKYDSSGLLKNDKSQLARKTATKDRIIEKIEQMQVEVGKYTYDGKSIPQETLSVYINPNPRDLYKAGIQTLREIATKIGNEDKYYNPHSLTMNCIQTSCSNKYFFDVDIDFKRLLSSAELDEIHSNLDKYLDGNYSSIMTRGGLHVLVHLKRLSQSISKTWYKNVNVPVLGTFDVMMNSDGLLPIPGCTQGGFIPYMI